MSEKTTTFPHQDLLNDNKVVIAELPKKTQDLIEKFKTLTDADAQDAMDEKIYGQVEDHLEEKAKKEKEAKVKQKVAEHKEKKKASADVSKAETAAGAGAGAAGAGAGAGTPPPPPAEKKSALGFLFGKK